MLHKEREMILKAKGKKLRRKFQKLDATPLSFLNSL